MPTPDPAAGREVEAMIERLVSGYGENSLDRPPLRAHLRRLADTARWEERERCAAAAWQAYTGAVMLGDDIAARSTGWVLNTIVGTRICEEGKEVPLIEHVYDAIRKLLPPAAGG